MTAVSGKARASRFFAYCQDVSRSLMRKRNVSAYRSRNVGTSNTLDRSIQIVEGFAFNNLGADFAANAEHGEPSFHSNEAGTLG
jgi:hypothetical protein